MRDSSRSLVCAIRGPITLITLGALFALNNFTPYQFNQTWPVLLIVFGLLTMLTRGTAPAAPAQGPQPPYTPPPQYTPPYDATAGPGSYRQSSYTQPSAQTPGGTVKGGFGTSAPPRAEQGQEPPQQPGGDS